MIDEGLQFAVLDTAVDFKNSVSAPGRVNFTARRVAAAQEDPICLAQVLVESLASLLQQRVQKDSHVGRELVLLRLAHGLECRGYRSCLGKSGASCARVQLALELLKESFDSLHARSE